MSWIDVEMKKWNDWHNAKNDEEIGRRAKAGILVISTDLQIGKLLNFFGGDLAAAAEFIDREIHDDSLSEAMSGDGYWHKVKERFLHLQINQIIVE